METTWLPKIRQELCTGCGDCVAACPEDALTTVQNKAALTYPDRCTYCALCEDLCPVAAIDLPFLICFVDESSAGRRQPEPTSDSPRATPDAERS